MYEERFYRQQLKQQGFFSCRSVVAEADVMVYSSVRLPHCAAPYLRRYYRQVAGTITRYPAFATSLSPLEINSAYPLIREMVRASFLAGVGPMATVAGAIAEFCGRRLLRHSPQVIVENGGDIFIAKKGRITFKPLVVGDEKLKDVVITLEERDYPRGICSSSSLFGHSLSLGAADLVTVVSRSTALADGLSTRLANMVKCTADIEKALAWGRRFEEVEGIYIVKGDRVGMWGEMEIAAARRQA